MQDVLPAPVSATYSIIMQTEDGLTFPALTDWTPPQPGERTVQVTKEGKTQSFRRVRLMELLGS